MRGTIKQRSTGSWTIILDLERDPNTGKRKQQWVTVKGTKRDAERRLAELLHQVDQGGYVKPARLTVGAFLQQWLRDYASTNVRQRTLEGYQDIVRAHLTPGLGDIPLAQLTSAHLQTYFARALKGGRKDGTGGLSSRSVLHHHRVLREALSHAVKWQLVARNVAEAVDPPRPEKVEMKTLDNAGVHRLLEASRATVYFPFLHLAVFTGMRRSELLALRWGDVDLNLANLSVVRGMHRARGAGFIFQPPKTAKSRRQVALSPRAVLALRSHREQQEAQQSLLGIVGTEDSLVFSRFDGSPLRPDTVTHAFADIAKRAGFNGIRSMTSGIVTPR